MPLNGLACIGRTDTYSLHDSPCHSNSLIFLLDSSFTNLTIAKHSSQLQYIKSITKDLLNIK